MKPVPGKGLGALSGASGKGFEDKCAKSRLLFFGGIDLNATWAVLGPLGTVLGAVLGLYWAALGLPWVSLGALVAPVGILLGSP